MKQTETSPAPVVIRSDKTRLGPGLNTHTRRGPRGRTVRWGRVSDRSGSHAPLVPPTAYPSNPQRGQPGLLEVSALAHHKGRTHLLLRAVPYGRRARHPVCPATTREARRCAY